MSRGVARSNGANLGLATVLGLGVVLVSDSSLAALGLQADRDRTMALFLIRQDDPDPKITATVVRGLESLAKRSGGMNIVAGNALRKRLRVKPMTAISRCGDDLACIAKLGKKARAGEIIYGRATGKRRSVEVEFLVIGTPQMTIQRRVGFQVTSIKGVMPALRDNFEKLTGATLPTRADKASLALDLEPLLEDLELTADTEPAVEPEVEQAPMVADEMSTLAVSEVDKAQPEIAATKTSKILEIIAAVPTKKKKKRKLAALIPPVNTAKVEMMRQQEDSVLKDVLLYGGFALAGIGAVGIGFGVKEYLGAKSLAAQIQDRQFSQVQTPIKQGEAQDGLRNAAIFGGAGAGLFAAGLGMAAAALFAFDEDTEVGVDVASESVMGNVRFAW